MGWDHPEVAKCDPGVDNGVTDVDNGTTVVARSEVVGGVGKVVSEQLGGDLGTHANADFCFALIPAYW